jgi:nicotinamidase-related amidase
MTAGDTALLVIDVQEKLLGRVQAPEALVRDIGYLIDVARLLDLPVLATEQNPEGLGPTVPDLARRLPERPGKFTFSCCSLSRLVDTLHREARPKVVLAGIEAHVCVLQTALDLLTLGFRVYVPADGVSSRRLWDRDFALRRLEYAGVILTTVETCAFEWLGSAAHPKFKEFNSLLQERDNPP